MTVQEESTSCRTLKLLEWLMMGGRIHVGKFIWCLSGDYQLCTVATNYDGSSEVFLICDGGLGAYRSLADEMTDEGYDVMLANLALNRT